MSGSVIHPADGVKKPSRPLRGKKGKAASAGYTHAEGFAPVFDQSSRVLILGSFPSVKSRLTDFYYGHPQNRFWKMLSTYFLQPMPVTNEEKRNLVLGHGVALWDVVMSCDVIGSKDDSIVNYTPAPLEEVFEGARIERILLNGRRAAAVFEEGYKDCGIPYLVMPSTSPANPRYRYEAWKEALDGIFGIRA